MAINSGLRQSMAASMAVSGRQWWTIAMNDGGWQQWTVDKVNGEKIN